MKGQPSDGAVPMDEQSVTTTGTSLSTRAIKDGMGKCGLGSSGQQDSEEVEDKRLISALFALARRFCTISHSYDPSTNLFNLGGHFQKKGIDLIGIPKTSFIRAIEGATHEAEVGFISLSYASIPDSDTVFSHDHCTDHEDGQGKYGEKGASSGEPQHPKGVHPGCQGRGAALPRGEAPERRGGQKICEVQRMIARAWQSSFRLLCLLI